MQICARGMPPSNLFVYGSLRRGSNNQFPRQLSDHSQCIGPARIRGQLFRIGGHGGAMPSGVPGDTVRGEVFRIDDPGGMLSMLDEYEGPEYERALVAADLDSGQKVEAWAYFYQGKQAGSRIASG